MKLLQVRTVTGNVTVASDYIFSWCESVQHKPALQRGLITATHQVFILVPGVLM